MDIEDLVHTQPAQVRGVQTQQSQGAWSLRQASPRLILEARKQIQKFKPCQEKKVS